MEQSVKERLKLFLKNENIKGIDFCEKIGVSSGFISGMRESIQPDKLKMIAINYPILSIEWLLTGEGAMYKGDEIKKLYKEIEILNKRLKEIEMNKIPNNYIDEDEQLEAELILKLKGSRNGDGFKLSFSDGFLIVEKALQ
jgi:transcriptional regulator with XRE-family HTH domain